MNILHYAGASVEGGLLTHVALLAGGQARAGHQVSAVLSPLPGADAAARRCGEAGVVVQRLSVRDKTDVAGMLCLRRAVASRRPDILHIHLSSPVEAMPALLAARSGGARRIVTTEHAPTWHPLERFYSKAAKKTLAHLVGAVIVVCESDAEFLVQRFGIRRDLLEVIPNGVPSFEELPARAEARRRLGLDDEVMVIGQVGALEVKKGVLDLLEAVHLCDRPGVALVLAGDGTLDEQLAARAKSLSFPMILTGRVGDVRMLLAALDVFVLASHQEAMPLSLLEAMHAGLPIVASRVGGIPEALQDGISGLLVTPGNPPQLGDALLRLLEDRTLAVRLGEKAAATARTDYSDSRMIRRVESVYRKLLARGEEAV